MKINIKRIRNKLKRERNHSQYQGRRKQRERIHEQRWERLFSSGLPGSSVKKAEKVLYKYYKTTLPFTSYDLDDKPSSREATDDLARLRPVIEQSQAKYHKYHIQKSSPRTMGFIGLPKDHSKVYISGIVFDLGVHFNKKYRVADFNVLLRYVYGVEKSDITKATIFDCKPVAKHLWVNIDDSLNAYHVPVALTIGDAVSFKGRVNQYKGIVYDKGHKMPGYKINLTDAFQIDSSYPELIDTDPKDKHSHDRFRSSRSHPLTVTPGNQFIYRHLDGKFLYRIDWQRERPVITLGKYFPKDRFLKLAGDGYHIKHCICPQLAIAQAKINGYSGRYFLYLNRTHSQLFWAVGRNANGTLINNAEQVENCNHKVVARKIIQKI